MLNTPYVKDWAVIWEEKKHWDVKNMYLKYVSTITVTRQSNMTKGGAETYLLKARSDFLLNSLQSTLREAGKERKKYLYNSFNKLGLLQPWMQGCRIPWAWLFGRLWVVTLRGLQTVAESHRQVGPGEKLSSFFPHGHHTLRKSQSLLQLDTHQK